MKENIFTLGAPRTGFTLLISIVNELMIYANKEMPRTDSRFIANTIIEIASIYLKKEFFNFFQNHIDMKDYMYNGEFELLVGGPKWINPNNKEECIIRKYIGIKDNGDFTFLMYLPKSALNYDKVVHSHYYPKSWVEDCYYDDYLKLASIRNPMGTINSAVFSINAITSEYIKNYIDQFDEDEFREIMALYKLTDLDLFDGLVRFLKSYLDEFLPIMNQFEIIRWEDIIDDPINTIQSIAEKLDIKIDKEQIAKIWDKLDHKNLPKHHLFNFRKGHGIVGEWKTRLTNYHLQIFEKYDFNKYLQLLGYEEIKYFNEADYNDFQKEVDSHIKDGKICNRITDDNLFKFCWNKSNIAVTEHKFDRFEREGFSQIERSSLKDKTLALEFGRFIQPKIALVHAMMKDFEDTANFEFNREKYFHTLIENLDDEQIKSIEKKFNKISDREKLELKLMEAEAFEIVLNEMEHFDIIGDDEHAQFLKEKFSKKLDNTSRNIVITDEDPSETLQNYLNKNSGVVIAKIGKKFFKKKSLFLISIPKAGTHLLFELAKAFGYCEGGMCPSNPKGGYWYYTEYSNSHTSAKHFFNETVYTSDFGNRDHPFVQNPALFIYRNPLDIVASEANYYHKEGKTSFSGYLNNLSYHERLAKLINDKWLLGSIRDRISNYIAWTYFDNVISLSFEELIGKKGDGCDALQKRLIWSLQLKLQVPGNPSTFAAKVFNHESATFFKGTIGSYKTLFKHEHYQLFNELNNDFMEALGYSMSNKYSEKISSFLSKKLSYNDVISFPPILKERNFNGYNIVKYANDFYGIPLSIGAIDIEHDALDASIIRSESIEDLKNTILSYTHEKLENSSLVTDSSTRWWKRIWSMQHKMH